MIKTTLKIDGMMCGMCESHINDVIRKNAKVTKVTASCKKGESVVISEAELNSEEITKAIADTGYTLVSLHSEPYEKKGLLRR